MRRHRDGELCGLVRNTIIYVAVLSPRGSKNFEIATSVGSAKEHDPKRRA